MTAPFSDIYARCYDLLYQSKDYAAEARYVADALFQYRPDAQTLLELGCGTGRYLEQFQGMGLRVHGVDLSLDMLERARARCGATADFTGGDVADLRLSKQFDAVVALFHVANYMASDEKLDRFFQVAAEHVAPGGVFLFDFWYGPAVLSDPPVVRVKRVADETIDVLRISEPVLHPNDNVVEVRFDNRIRISGTGQSLEQQETHRMRYLFLPEIDRQLRASDFDRVGSYRWMTREELGIQSWYGFVAARRMPAGRGAACNQNS